MATITGTPFARVGEVDANCAPSLAKTPAPCSSCRQLDRWLTRTVGWVVDSPSRFKNILRAILVGHDEILQALCGTCANNPDAETTCDCVVQQFLALGFSLEQNVIPAESCPLIITQQITWPVGCPVICDICPDQECFHFIEHPTATECGEVVCDAICPACQTIVMDPCNNPGHLDIILRLTETAQANTPRTGKGADIVAALETLFPASAPRIVKVEFGAVYVMLNRALTLVEQQFINQLLAAVPAGFGVKIELVTPCV